MVVGRSYLSELSREIDFVSGDAFQYQGRDVNDEINTEVQRYVPKFFPNEIIRVGPFVQSLIVDFRLVWNVVVIVRLIQNHLVRVGIMLW